MFHPHRIFFEAVSMPAMATKRRIMVE